MYNNHSKSMFTNKMYVTRSRSIIDPVGESLLRPIIIKNNPIIGLPFEQTTLDTFQIIETYYGSNLKNKTYTNVPSDYQKYIDLYVIMQNLEAASTDSNILLVLKLVQEALVGAINAFALYGQQTVLQIDNTNLQNTINTILSNKNNTKIATQPTNTGQMSITKTFTLAAVFNYYIVIFGMPEFGVGFDPVKISFLVHLLTNMGIDPYK